MERFTEKLSSYDLFNNLFPGALMGLAVENIFDLRISTYNIGLILVVYYFFGLIISRIGSMFIELIKKKTNFIKMAEYYDYINACNIDEKIETLLETANMYRSLFIVGVVVFILTLSSMIISGFLFIKFVYTCCSILVGILFLFSYKKQISYINKRVGRSVKK